ncbi:hypothetical protein CEXT_281 [Caerostris extrusa]|uniref:Uncharacterized protein n=1 Tax=Caerostris extrusa TaxID=172846 RepID=A0AAV4V841_CAEEX|nr:hypothetical protein CEXT_281 [Caerostris extrusa]
MHNYSSTKLTELNTPTSDRAYGSTCIYVKNTLVHPTKTSLTLHEIESTTVEAKLNNAPPITTVFLDPPTIQLQISKT